MPGKSSKSKKKKSIGIKLLRGLAYLAAIFVFLLVLAYAIALVNKEKILAAINDQLKTSLNGDIEIGSLNFSPFEKFPAFSIILSDIYLRGPRYDQYREDFFNANKISIDVEPMELIRGTISLQSIHIMDGNIFAFRASDGYTNTDIFKKKDGPVKDTTKSAFAPTIALKKIVFLNTRILYFDSVKRKSYGLTLANAEVAISSTDSSRQVAITGDLNFAGMMLNEAKGSYLFNKPTHSNLNIEMISDKNGMVIRPSVIQFQKSKIELSGEFDFSAPGSFELFIHAPNLDYAEGTTIVTRALNEKLGKYQLDSPIDLKVRLMGSLAAGEPKVDMSFVTTANHFTTKKIEIKNIAFSGTFTNHIDSTLLNGDPNSRLAFDSFSGVISGIPTTGKVAITHLNSPDLDLDTHASLSLTDLNAHSDTTRIKFLSGNFTADIKYSGKLIDYIEHKQTEFDGILVGSATIENGAWNMPRQQKKFDNTNVSVRFTSEQMDIEKLNFSVNGNLVEIKGLARGFIPFIFEPAKKGYVNLSVYSKKLNLTPLIKGSVKKRTESKMVAGKHISEFIDMLYNKVEFDLSLKVDELVKGSLYGTNLEGKVNLLKGQLRAGPMKMNTAGGTVSLTLEMKNLDRPINEVIVSADVKNADIKKFFKSFDNFSQKTITSDNLNGKITTKIRLRGSVNDNFKIQMAALTGNVEFIVKEAEVNDFEPLQNMSNFLFKKRDFSRVRFAEIKSTFKIDSTSIQLERMEVQSTVFYLFVEGTYSLAENTDLSIQVPLKNLKKRDATYKPENIGVDAKVGPSIFIRARKDSKTGKTVLVYDPFKKMRKK